MDPEVPKYRKKRKKKMFAIEWRSKAGWSWDWRLWKRYATLRDRNAALTALQRQNPELFEYRAGN